MKSVLVTGANGQLGKTLRFLHAKSIDLTYNFYSKKDLNILNREELITKFEKIKPSHCINCAAYTNVDGAETNRELALEINVQGVKNLVDLCNEFNTTLLHISTDYVFDGLSNKPYKEEDRTNPINHYGYSKYLGEQAIIARCKKYYIVRTSWLYSHYSGNFLDFIIQKSKSNESLLITTESTGSPTSSLSLSRFLNFLVESWEIPHGIYHFSGEGETTWYGFAEEIIKTSKNYNFKKLFRIESYHTIAQRPNYSVLDLSRTKLFYKNIPSWKDSLKETIRLNKK